MHYACESTSHMLSSSCRHYSDVLGPLLGTEASEMAETPSLPSRSCFEKREVNSAGFGHCLGLGNRGG